MSQPAHVYLGIPSHNGEMRVEAAASAYARVTDRRMPTVGTLTTRTHTSSLLARGFNALWSEALAMAKDGKITHFAMHHCDVEADPERGPDGNAIEEVYWLDRFLFEMDLYGLDVISAVVPIKDQRGVTSTAIDDPRNKWGPRRFTMSEIMRLPKTFTAADAGCPGGVLLVNTALWVADLRRPWCLGEWRQGMPCSFTINDRLWWHWSSSQLGVDVASEDWEFSRMAHHFGAKIAATRCVRVKHHGAAAFCNWESWGSYETDSEYERCVGERDDAVKFTLPEPAPADVPDPIMARAMGQVQNNHEPTKEEVITHGTEAP